MNVLCDIHYPSKDDIRFTGVSLVENGEVNHSDRIVEFYDNPSKILRNVDPADNAKHMCQWFSLPIISPTIWFDGA